MQTNKIKIIIIILLILLVLISILGTVLYLTTDLLKSKETLFQKYIAQNVENIAEVFDISSETEMADLLRNSDYTESSDITLNYLENENDEEEVYNLKEQGIINNSQKTSYRKLDASYGEENLVSTELLKEDDTYGLRLSSLVQQFVSVKNSSIDYLVSSMGYDGKYLSETLQGVDVSGLLQFSDEEIKTLQSKYVDVIFSDIDSSSYSSKGNVLITLNNGQSITTHSYTLKINKNELDKIYKRVLTQAVSDQIILSKITQIDDKIKEAGFEQPEGKSLKENYVEKLQKMADSIEYLGEDSREIVFTVYQAKGVTYRTLIKTENAEFSIDLDNTHGKTLSLKIEELTNEGSNTQTYTLGKEDINDGTKRELSYKNDNKSWQATISKIKTENQIAIDGIFDYNSENLNSINLELSSDISLNNTDNIPVSFEENNNIILNDFEGDRIITILESLKNRLIRSLENSQSNINTKLLNNILVWADSKKQEQESREQDNIEQQKQRFNNQFVLYQGENLKAEHVQKLIKVISKNMSDYQVVSGNKIKVLVEKGAQNEDKANDIATVISEDYTYNVEIEYSEEGLVNIINISVYEEDDVNRDGGF